MKSDRHVTHVLNFEPEISKMRGRVNALIDAGVDLNEPTSEKAENVAKRNHQRAVENVLAHFHATVEQAFQLGVRTANKENKK